MTQEIRAARVFADCATRCALGGSTKDGGGVHVVMHDHSRMEGRRGGGGEGDRGEGGAGGVMQGSGRELAGARGGEDAGGCDYSRINRTIYTPGIYTT